MSEDNASVGRIYDVSPQLAIMMIAAGWARVETRARARRTGSQTITVNRRRTPDRRSTAH